MRNCVITETEHDTAGERNRCSILQPPRPCKDMAEMSTIENSLQLLCVISKIARHREQAT